METIKRHHLKRYRRETKELFYLREVASLWIGIVLFPVFAILDFIVVREYFVLFFQWRIYCSIFFLGLLYIHYKKFGRIYPFIIAVIAYLVATLTISMMIVKMGGFGSMYYVGIILVMVTCAAILPLNTNQALLSGILFYAGYVTPVLVLCEPKGDDMRVFFSNSFFFISFITIITIKSYEETKARKREFNLKMALDYYAHNLEIEVEKRAKKLEESELRYRELYENIIDMVILIDAEGKIIMANPRYYAAMGIRKVDTDSFSFMDFIHPDDYNSVKISLMQRLQKKENVKDFQFKIINAEQRLYEVECNAKYIKKNSTLIGFQMVIRDITERKLLEKNLFESYKKLQDARASTILGLAKLAEYRDQETGSHLERMREYSKIIAEELSKRPKYKELITKEFIDDIYRSSILHDIGKVGIPDAILLKPGKLSSEEFEVIKRHTTFGGDALKAVESTIEGKSFLSVGKEIAYCHHEKWDGTGYPNGLKGEEIPLSTRLVSIADVYDALTSKRGYKEAFSHEKSREILANERGKHFDPDVVEAFLANEKKFETIREQMNA